MSVQGDNSSPSAGSGTAFLANVNMVVMTRLPPAESPLSTICRDGVPCSSTAS